MRDIGLPNQIPHSNGRWLADNTERKRAVVKIVRRGLCGNRDFEFRLAAGCTKLREAASQRQDQCLDAPNTRREKMRIDKQFHDGRLAGSVSFISLSDALASAFFAANSSPSFATVFNGQYIGFGPTTLVVTFRWQTIFLF